MLLVDGSASMRSVAPQLVTALRAVPPAARLGLIIATEPIQRVPLAPASEAHKQHIARLLGSASFVGGQDNGPALAEALLALEPEAAARLLWVHGPQPVAFRRSAAQIEQAIERLSHVPEVTLYAVEPGPNELLPDRPWGWGARLLPRTASPEADIGRFLERELGDAPRLIVRRTGTGSARAATPAEPAPAEARPKGSDHIARLWAKDRVETLMRDKGANRAEAVKLAAQYRLVTPVSGAVVLETKQQYQESGLEPVAQTSVPTVPEPHEWALLLVAAAALGWLTWHYRRRRTVAA
jgi:hypothetical protein